MLIVIAVLSLLGAAASLLVPGGAFLAPVLLGAPAPVDERQRVA